MSTIVIKIRRKHIIGEVHKMTAYVGAKRTTAEDDAHDRIRTVKEDAPFLEKYLFQALESLKVALHPYYKDMTGNFDLLLEVPMNFDEIQTDNLQDIIEDYLMSQILSEWFAIQDMKDDRDLHSNNATAIMETITQTINMRKRPIPPIYDKEHNIIQRKHIPEF